MATDDAMPKKGSTLYLQVLIGIALGILLGWAKPDWGIALKPLGDGFVRLIKLLMSPIIFTTVVAGISGMGNLKKVGRVGAKALLWFEAMTTLALALGFTMVHVVRPGDGIHARVDALDTSTLDKTLAGPHPDGIVDHLLAMIPESFVGAFVSGDVLQVLVLAVLTGIAVAGLGEKAKPITSALDAIGSGLFAIVSVVMRLAPLGAFGAMAYTIGTYGLGTLGHRPCTSDLSLEGLVFTLQPGDFDLGANRLAQAALGCRQARLN